MGDIVIGRRDHAALNHHHSTTTPRHACGVETVVDRSCFFLFFSGGVDSMILNLPCLSICLEDLESVR